MARYLGREDPSHHSSRHRDGMARQVRASAAESDQSGRWCQRPIAASPESGIRRETSDARGYQLVHRNWCSHCSRRKHLCKLGRAAARLSWLFRSASWAQWCKSKVLLRKAPRQSASIAEQ